MPCSSQGRIHDLFIENPNTMGGPLFMLCLAGQCTGKHQATIILLQWPNYNDRLQNLICLRYAQQAGGCTSQVCEVEVLATTSAALSASRWGASHGWPAPFRACCSASTVSFSQPHQRLQPLHLALHQ